MNINILGWPGNAATLQIRYIFGNLNSQHSNGVGIMINRWIPPNKHQKISDKEEQKEAPLNKQDR